MNNDITAVIESIATAQDALLRMQKVTTASNAEVFQEIAEIFVNQERIIAKQQVEIAQLQADVRSITVRLIAGGMLP